MNKIIRVVYSLKISQEIYLEINLEIKKKKKNSAETSNTSDTS